MYSGVYNGSKKHEPDLNNVLSRAWAASLDKIVITGGNLKESAEALILAKTDGKYEWYLYLYHYAESSSYNKLISLQLKVLFIYSMILR